MNQSLRDFYGAFVEAVTTGRSQRLEGFLHAPEAAGNALVYRNTVFRGAADALATAYPAVARLGGANYFEAVAVAFVQWAPPLRRTLVDYGERFPEFLAEAPGIESTPYLTDVARLDRAWLSAHRAADAATLSPDALQDLAPERLSALCLRLHPSVRIIRLAWDVHDAWKANRDEAGESQQVRSLHNAPQCVLIWRPQHEVRTQIISDAEADFLEHVEMGLADAAALAQRRDPNLEISAVFAGVIAAGLFAADQPDMTPDEGS